MVDRHVDNRIVCGRQYLRDLVGPRGPRARAPKIVSPDEPALEQVRSELLSLQFGEDGRPCILERDERTLKERIIVHDPDHEVVGSLLCVRPTFVLVSSEKRMLKLKSPLDSPSTSRNRRPPADR